MFSLSTQTYVLIFVVAIGLGGALSLLAGWGLSRRADSEPFFMVRQQMLRRRWSYFIVGGALLLMALCGQLFGVRAVEIVITPTMTPSSTPTLTLTPTATPTASLTLSPSQTLRPSLTVSPTQTQSPTASGSPAYPELLITNIPDATVTPNPDTVIGLFTFAQDYTTSYDPINGGVVFEVEGLTQIVTLFTYTGMIPEVQWTTVWFYESEPVYIETFPWDGFEAGFAVTKWENEDWRPGNYQVRIYVGEELKQAGQFRVVESPTATPEQ